jgi:flagellin
MSSLLTNTGAMVALQTLKSTNANLARTQNEISTGKSVASAKDNAAVWAISKVMESDVSGFKAISDSLSLGESTVGVALAGAEQISDILKDMKERIVSATGENVDYTKLTAEVNEMKKQIGSIMNASQFNGANLLRTTGGTTGTDVTVLSSLDRASDGTVTASNITVSSVDFETDFGTFDGTDPSTMLTDIDVSSATAAETSLTNIETHLQTAIDGAAALGAAAKRIEDQSSFVGKLTDAMKTGIGSLVDADMEEASARLQALQTQQQLGIQALSIANQAPQSIMSLFR